MAGRIGSTVLVTAAMCALTLGIGAVVLDVHVDASMLPGLLLGILFGTVAFTALGIGFVRFLPSADTAGPMQAFLVMPIAFVSNVFFPLDDAPQWLDKIASALPLKPLADQLHTAFEHSSGSGIVADDLMTLAIWADLIGVRLGGHKWLSQRSTRNRRPLITAMRRPGPGMPQHCTGPACLAAPSCEWNSREEPLMHVARMARDGVPFGPNRHHGWRRWLGAGFGMLWLLIPIVDLAQSDPSPGHVALAAIGSVTFVGFYLGRAMRWPSSDRETLITVGTMAVVATVLTLFERSTWGLLFVYTAAAGGLRLPPNRNFAAVIGSTVLCALTMSVSESDAGTIISITATTLGIGVLFVALGGVIRANIELREARAELARAGGRRGARCASRATCTTCSATSLSLIALKAQLARQLLPDRPRDGGGRRRRHPRTSRATRCARCARPSAATAARRSTPSSPARGWRSRRPGSRPTVDRPEVALPPDVEAVLAWTVREAATNVIRHSGARHSAIRLVRRSATATRRGRRRRARRARRGRRRRATG